MSIKEKNGEARVDKGIIFLAGGVTEEKCEKICREIIQLNIEQEVPFIQMIINSTGGYCSAGFAIIDIMEWSRIPVYTTGIGMIASMALLIFISGEKGRRVVTPRTSILSHRYSTNIGGNYSSLVAARVEEDLMHQRIINHYIQHSKLKTEKDLNEKLLRDIDTWLTPEKSLEYGLADMIQQDVKNPYPNYKLSAIV